MTPEVMEACLVYIWHHSIHQFLSDHIMHCFGFVGRCLCYLWRQYINRSDSMQVCVSGIMIMITMQMNAIFNDSMCILFKVILYYEIQARFCLLLMSFKRLFHFSQQHFSSSSQATTQHQEIRFTSFINFSGYLSKLRFCIRTSHTTSLSSPFWAQYLYFY